MSHDLCRCDECGETYYFDHGHSCKHTHVRGSMSFDSLPPQYVCQICGVMFSLEQP
jgi:hypothetical protein